MAWVKALKESGKIFEPILFWNKAFFLFLSPFPSHSSGIYSLSAVLDTWNIKTNGTTLLRKHTQSNAFEGEPCLWARHFSTTHIISIKTHLYYWHSDNELKGINDSKNFYCCLYILICEAFYVELIGSYYIITINEIVFFPIVAFHFNCRSVLTYIHASDLLGLNYKIHK